MLLSWRLLIQHNQHPYRKKKCGHGDIQACDDGGRDRNDVSASQGMSGLLATTRSQERDLVQPPRSLQKDSALLTSWFWTPDLQNWETVNFCCFKLLSLRWFVTAAQGHHPNPCLHHLPWTIRTPSLPWLLPHPRLASLHVLHSVAAMSFSEATWKPGLLWLKTCSDLGTYCSGTKHQHFSPSTTLSMGSLQFPCQVS